MLKERKVQNRLNCILKRREVMDQIIVKVTITCLWWVFSGSYRKKE